MKSQSRKTRLRNALNPQQHEQRQTNNSHSHSSNTNTDSSSTNQKTTTRRFLNPTTTTCRTTSTCTSTITTPMSSSTMTTACRKDTTKLITMGRKFLLLMACIICILATLGGRQKNYQLFLLVPPQEEHANNNSSSSSSSSGGGHTTSSTSTSSTITTITTSQRIDFDTTKPIIVVSLPNTGRAILSRYFQCGGYTPEQVGQYWTRSSPDAPDRRPIGDCMDQNMKERPHHIFENCGNYSIWQDVAMAQPLHHDQPDKHQYNPHCFSPFMTAGAPEAFAKSYPNGATLMMIRAKSWKEWYKTQKSYDLHTQWSQWCNPTHYDSFPMEDTEVAYIKFIHVYHQRILTFIHEHPRWNLIDIDYSLDSDMETANRLQGQLGIDAKCWMESVQGTMPSTTTTTTTTITTTAQEKVLEPPQTRPRPNDITFPLLVASLPKCGTATVQKYFECHLGEWATVHQGVRKTQPPHEAVTIGQCMQENIRNHTDVLSNCGHARVFADIGHFNTWMNSGNEGCYYPQLHGGLDEFAKSYPYATVLLAIRDAKSWVSSVQRWYGLNDRWARFQLCQDTGSFPPPGSSKEEWEAFYLNHVNIVRQFARRYPTITYIEIPLTDDAGPMMDDIFGFHKACWGHHHVNDKFPEKS